MRYGSLFLGLTALGVFAALAGAADDKPPAGIAVDKDKRAVIIDAKVAPRKLEYLKGEVYPIEVIACWPYNKDGKRSGKKSHETVVTIDVDPSAVQKALE